MNTANLITISYWFNQPFPALGWIKWTWVVIFLCLVAIGFVLMLIKQIKIKDKIIKKIYSKFANLVFFTGIFGLLWMFFRQERVPLLSMRFWLLLIGLVFIFGLYRVLRYIFKRLPAIKREKFERENIKRYIP